MTSVGTGFAGAISAVRSCWSSWRRMKASCSSRLDLQSGAATAPPGSAAATGWGAAVSTVLVPSLKAVFSPPLASAPGGAEGLLMTSVGTGSAEVLSVALSCWSSWRRMKASCSSRLELQSGAATASPGSAAATGWGAWFSAILRSSSMICTVMPSVTVSRTEIQTASPSARPLLTTTVSVVERRMSTCRNRSRFASSTTST